MNQETILTKTVIVPPHKLHIHKEYIEKKLRELEGKNYSNEVGFIYGIREVLTVENYAMVKNDFSGCIVYKTTFIVDNCNPEQGSVVECKVTQIGKLTVASNNPLKIIIIPQDIPQDLQTADSVNVLVLAKEINHGAECIKVVGKFVSKN